MKRNPTLVGLALLAGATALALACAPAVDDGATTEDPDAATGNPYDPPDPDGGADPCALGDCDDDAGDPPPELDGGADATVADGGPASPWVVGAKLLTRGYSAFHTTASASSGTLAVDPGEGVANDSIHLWGQTAGTIPPGQSVVLASATKTNGYWKITYDGKTGWVGASHLFLHDTAKNPVDFFLGLSMAQRNAFFKRQAHRSAWNADGPSMSGTCAPTSLAMAVHILRKEPAHLSVEQSIHRVRKIYGDDSDLGGTNLSQIYTAATSNTLDLHANKLWSTVTPSGALTRLDAELAKKHMVVLAGVPGQVGSTRSTYEKAFDAAYSDAGLSVGYGFDPDTCHCEGTHSILVVGRDKSGGYVVGDPMSEVGFVAVSASAIKDYMSRWTYSGTGNAVW